MGLFKIKIYQLIQKTCIFVQIIIFILFAFCAIICSSVNFLLGKLEEKANEQEAVERARRS